MNKNTFNLIIISVIALTSACKSKSSFLGSTPKKEMDSVSYAIGIQMGENLKQNGLDSTLNVDFVARGIYEVLNNSLKKTLKNQVLKQLQVVCNTKLFLKEQVLSQHFLMW